MLINEAYGFTAGQYTYYGLVQGRCTK